MFPKFARVSNASYEAAVNVEWKGYITVGIARIPEQPICTGNSLTQCLVCLNLDSSIHQAD